MNEVNFAGLQISAVSRQTREGIAQSAMKTFYSEEDFSAIKNLIETRGLKKLFITGDVETGKSCFCKRLIKEIGTYRFIELDKGRDMSPLLNREAVLKGTIKEREGDSYILEHYQLLDQNTLGAWKDAADALILLNPKRENIRNGFDYDTGPTQKNNFDGLSGELVYSNPKTGTFLKIMSKKEMNDR
ncbi:MAG: hypothetical protein HYY10_03150 [Candidatus Liptonbacteria bacterium]|nr:hypothetical protein [Candidatus Liptonbacteria bacterium]